MTTNADNFEKYSVIKPKIAHETLMNTSACQIIIIFSMLYTQQEPGNKVKFHQLICVYM